jgi:spore germination protein KC
MKRLLIIILTFLICGLSGCTYDMSRKEIDEIDLVLILGIDYADGQYSLSALYSPGSGTGGSGGGGGGGGSSQQKGSDQGSEQLANGSGKTAYEALRDLIQKNKKAVSLAQAGTFLIGEGAAKQGLKPSIDFLSRDETIKMEALLYVTKGMSAADFIKIGQENKKTIHEDMEAMKQKQKELLTRNDNTMVNILNETQQSLSCVMIPYMIADESGYLIDGYAVFDHLILCDYLDHQTSDGVYFFRNLIRSYPINIDNQVGLQITYTKTKLKADLNDKNITVTVKVSFETMIKEILTDKNIFTRDELNSLAAKQNDYIKAILEKPVKYSISHGLDILNLARVVENQNISGWKNIEASWTELISKIKYKYTVQSRISKSFIIGVK